jgi:RNA polymerase sigma-70 factor, ECF subfamily
MDPVYDRSDGELAARIAAGDERAFMAVYDAHAPLLFGVVVRVLGDRDAAADVVQEVFVTLWRQADRFDAGRGSLRTWLARIARNRALDQARAVGRAPRQVRWLRPGGPGMDDTPDQGPDAATPEPGPDTAIEQRWAQALVRAALAEMPADERVMLGLAYDGGLSQSEIAVRLSLPLGTVKSRTRRAMARLRAVLGAVPDLAPAVVQEAGSGQGGSARSSADDDPRRREEVRRGSR